MSGPAEAVWFGPAAAPLFGLLHLPDDGTARGGVLLAPPFGYEYTCAHRTFRVLAEHLADIGLAALRFDHTGTGDSGGASHELPDMRPWLAGTGHAADLLRSLGLTSVTAIGMRFGAAIALAAPDLNGVVLWDPVLSGREYLREMQLLGEASLARAPGLIRTPDWFGEKSGNVMLTESERARRAMEAVGIDLNAGLQASIEAHRAIPATSQLPLLVLTREDRPSARVRRLLASQAGVTFAEVGDQGALLDGESLEAHVPVDGIGQVCAWLDTRYEDRSRPVTTDGLSTHTTIPTAGHPLTERALRIGPSGLFGILSGEPAAAEQPVVICLNNSVDHHVGPGRLWVELARDLAAGGGAVLRLDLGGLGDSGGRTGQPVDRPYPLTVTADLLAAMETIDAPRGFVLVGSCSGGRNALSSSVLPDTRGVVAVNTALHVPLDVEQLISPDDPVPRRLRQINTDHRLQRQVVERIPPMLWRLRRTIGLGVDSETLLADLDADRVRALLVYGEDDFHRWKSKEILRSLTSRRGGAPFDLTTLRDLDHGLLLRSSRARLTGLIEEYLQGTFAPVGAPASRD
jgi:alpha-beta hydrolase superfamily lysophospholipase